jgi:hypothetical protein
MSIRNSVAENIVEVLKTIEYPQPVLVTREPFQPQELAITQFPAVLVQITTEDRETITMGAPNVGRRQGTILYQLRCYVRGTELDRKRNEFLEAIEETLDSDRYRDLKATGVLDSQIRRIEIIDRLAPLAEFVIDFEVKYNYLRTAT